MNPVSSTMFQYSHSLRDILILACSTSIFIVIAVTSFRSSAAVSVKSFTCEDSLKQQHYGKHELGHPTPCLLKDYKKPDVVKCLNGLASLNRRNKSRSYWHIAFAGDSRMRQMYNIFYEMIPDYDLKVQGNTYDRRIDYHEDVAVMSKLLDVKVSFFWRPHPDQSMVDVLTNWTSKKDTPDVFVTGNMLWTMVVHKDNDTLAYYKERLRIVGNLLQKLKSRKKMKTIWWDQDYVNEKLYHSARVGAPGDINNRRIDDYNKAATRIMRKAGAMIWTSTHPLFHEYTRGCHSFPERLDSWRYWTCPDTVHTSYYYAQLYHRQLVNYLCNPVMNLDQEYCCSWA